MPNIFEKIKEIQQQRYKDKIKKHPYPTKVKFHLGSFLDAINGFIWTLKTQPNFAVELICFILVLYLYLFFALLNINFDLIEVVFIFILSITLMAFELLNTSIEALSDEVAQNEYKDFIRIAKDTSAAAVFLMGVANIATCLFYITPKLLQILLLLV